jgi:hypothetical protein
MPDSVRCGSPLSFLVHDCATPWPGTGSGNGLQGTSRGAGPGPVANRTHEPVTRRGDVQLTDGAHAAREHGAISWLGEL